MLKLIDSSLCSMGFGKGLGSYITAIIAVRAIMAIIAMRGGRND